ncbi:MAG: hypothetical protein U9R29_10450 [Thermodesulfobacteriota bacterium]|nr:hypothetical protein [Thermodesulfobacteriota bacterium]
MMRFGRLCVVVILLSLLLPVVVYAAEPSEKTRFVVMRVDDQTGHEGWENHLIAYGIRNIVNSELFDTGSYLPVEDRLEITDQIDSLIASRWSESSPEKQQSDLDQEVLDNTDCVVSVVVRDFKVKRRRSIGLFSAAKTTIQISVDVELKHHDGTVQKVSGKGKGVTKSMGLLFQIREDKVHFNETTVGQATQEAIHHAITKL